MERAEWLLRNLVTDDGVEAPPEIPPPSEIRGRREETEASSSWVEQLRDQSKRASTAVITPEYERFARENDRLVDEERKRLEKLYDFQARFFANRTTSNEELIAHWELVGTEEQKQTIPARRGLIRADRERIARVEEERAAAIEALEARRQATHEVGLAGMTLLRPPQAS